MSQWQEIQNLLTVKQVAKLLRVNRSTVFRMLGSGVLPQPIRYNKRVIGFRVSDMQEHIAGDGVPGPLVRALAQAVK
jgi:predicted DNA-binding transcriptional regulator AlpA